MRVQHIEGGVEAKDCGPQPSNGLLREIGKSSVGRENEVKEVEPKYGEPRCHANHCP